MDVIYRCSCWWQLNHSVSYNFMQLRVQESPTSSWPVLYFHWSPSMALLLPFLSLGLPQTLGQKHGHWCSCPFSPVPYYQSEAAHAVQLSGCFYKQLFFCTSPLKWHLSLSTFQGAARSQELTHFSTLSLGKCFWVPVRATHLIKTVVILKLSRANCLFLLFIQTTILQRARS